MINVELYYTSAFYIFIYYAILHFIIYLGISPSSDHKKMKYSKISKNTNKNHKLYTKKIIFVNINPGKIKFISLDLSHQDDSNKPKMIKIQSLNRLKTGVYRIRNFENTLEISKILRIFI
jgi:hypothetical protein